MQLVLSLSLLGKSDGECSWQGLALRSAGGQLDPACFASGLRTEWNHAVDRGRDWTDHRRFGLVSGCPQLTEPHHWLRENADAIDGNANHIAVLQRELGRRNDASTGHQEDTEWVAVMTMQVPDEIVE